ncbi:hypothetical protein K3495_g12765 [Podosphaera aphanis]|nr:hypothetical protein K3495_g12765 [Podosphaera aphanis]
MGYHYALVPPCREEIEAEKLVILEGRRKLILTEWSLPQDNELGPFGAREMTLSTGEYDWAIPALAFLSPVDCEELRRMLLAHLV